MTPPPELELVAEGLAFPEGPVALADGSVVVTEIAAGRVTRVAPDGAGTLVAETGGGPNGLAIGPDGALWCCNNGGRFSFAERDGLLLPGDTPPGHAGGSIQRIDMATGRVDVVYEACGGRRLRAPNDLVFDGDGGFWFTDHGTGDSEGRSHGALFHARADGSAITCARRGLLTPNGVGLSPDGRVVYVAETLTGRLWAFDVTGPGVLAPPRPWAGPGRLVATLPGYQLFDSLAVEADGRVCVATLMNGGISVVTPAGEVEHVPAPDRMTTNIAFGGADMRTAWITASSTRRLYRARWPRPGLRLAFNA